MDGTRRIPREGPAQPLWKAFLQRDRGVRRVRRDQIGCARADRDWNQGNAAVHKWIGVRRMRNDDLLLARTIQPEQTLNDRLVQSLVESTEAATKSHRLCQLICKTHARIDIVVIADVRLCFV